MYEAMKNPYATNKGGVIKPTTKPDVENVKTVKIKGNDLRVGK